MSDCLESNISGIGNEVYKTQSDVGVVKPLVTSVEG
jgi:hypothetical protein